MHVCGGSAVWRWKLCGMRAGLAGFRAVCVLALFVESYRYLGRSSVVTCNPPLESGRGQCA